MIAIFGLVGGQHFASRYVTSRKEGETWHAAHLARLGEDQSTLSAYRQSDVLTDAQAKATHYRDGCCPFGMREQGRWLWTVQTVADAAADEAREDARRAAYYDEIAADALAARSE